MTGGEELGKKDRSSVNGRMGDEYKEYGKILGAAVGCVRRDMEDLTTGNDVWKVSQREKLRRKWAVWVQEKKCDGRGNGRASERWRYEEEEGRRVTKEGE